MSLPSKKEKMQESLPQFIEKEEDNQKELHLDQKYSENNLDLKIYSRLSLYSVLAYISFFILGDLLLAEKTLFLLGFDPTVRSFIQNYKFLIFLAISAPLFYWMIFKFSLKIKEQNIHLQYNENKLMHLVRIYRMVIKVNQCILRSHHREPMLHEICQIACKYGEFSFAWVGLGETQTLLPNIVVFAGRDKEYLEDLFNKIKTAAVEERGEPAMFVWRKKYHIVVNNVEDFSKKLFSWQLRATQKNYRSIAAFPIKTTAGMVGVIGFYSEKSEAFSEEGTDLLCELTADINFILSDLEQKEQVYYAANYDVVTSLPNHYLFKDRLNQAIARAFHDKRCLGIIIIELRDLKNIIESHGQAEGDRLLLETGKHLSHLVRDGDTVARLPANELAVLLSDVAEFHDISVVTSRLLRPFLLKVAEQEIKIHFRAGIAMYPKDGKNAQVLITNAQQTLADLDRNDSMEYAFYSKDISKGMKYSQKIKEELAYALKRQEFFLYYQPIINLQSSLTTGVEVLMRWRNAALGEVSPMQFIHLAEEIELMPSLNEWIITTACLQLKEWKAKGFDNLTLSINLTGKQLFENDGVKKIQQIFEKMQFNPKEYSLAIEIAESVLINEPHSAISLFAELRDLGLKIYLDDFGVGYASLNYLHQLPVDALKIDSMIIRSITKNQGNKALTQGIFAFAKGLEIMTIAEGVETEEQLNILKELGCDAVQGYFFSPPVPAQNVEKLFGKKL